ncbi:MAG: HEPN domain-containing protein [Bacteroidales bacterium]
MKDKHNEYIRQWLLKADEDLLVVNTLISHNFSAKASICFHCQQAAEKYLKAFLIAHDKDFPKTHSIEYLLAACSAIDKAFEQVDPVNLSDFGVGVRYPGDLYLPTEDEVLTYKEIVLSIKELVDNRLSSNT